MYIPMKVYILVCLAVLYYYGVVFRVSLPLIIESRQHRIFLDETKV